MVVEQAPPRFVPSCDALAGIVYRSPLISLHRISPTSSRRPAVRSNKRTSELNGSGASVAAQMARTSSSSRTRLPEAPAAFLGPIPATIGETKRLCRVACQDMTLRTIASASFAIAGPLASVIAPSKRVTSFARFGGLVVRHSWKDQPLKRAMVHVMRAQRPALQAQIVGGYFLECGFWCRLTFGLWVDALGGHDELFPAHKRASSSGTIPLGVSRRVLPFHRNWQTHDLAPFSVTIRPNPARAASQC
jgi:hypothetical protein